MANNTGNNNNKNGKGNKGGNLRGILTLIAWALVLTVAFNYFSAYNRNTANKSTSHEIKYSEMIEMVEKNQVEEILFKDSTIYVTPVEGYVYTEEVTTGGKTEEKSYKQTEDTKLTLYTAYLSNSELLPLLKEHKVAYTGYYEAEMNPILLLMINYILPVIIMVGLFMLLMRLMSKSGGGGFGGSGFGGQYQPQPQKGRDMNVTLNVSFDEAFNGCVKKVSVRNPQGGVETLDVKVPAGAVDGGRVRFRGKGAAGANGGPAGDLLVTTKISEHPLYSRHGADVLMTVPITVSEAALGAKIVIPAPDGTKIRVSVPAGSQDGTELKISGKGAPNVKGSGSGALRITFHVEIPKHMTEQQEQAMIDFQAACEHAGQNVREHLGV